MIKRLFCFTALSLGLAYGAQAQGVGVLSRTGVYQSMPSFLKDLSMIDSMQQAYTREMTNEGQRLQEQARMILTSYEPKENETIDQMRKRMKPQDTMALRTVFNKDAALVKKKEAYDTRLSKLQAEKVTPVMKAIDAAIKVVAKEERLDLVYFLEDVASATAYINEEKNITNKVIDQLKKKK